jgi:3'5'-cyclic nucleotide phosphodiesterase
MLLQLTQFSCVLSALIHDVDHPGVPNSQLCIENKVRADVYQSKSVAEQNSLDLSWDMLMDDQFADLRAAIYTTEVERQRFRSLVVNSVMVRQKSFV